MTDYLDDVQIDFPQRFGPFVICKSNISDSRCRFEKLADRLVDYHLPSKTREESSRLLNCYTFFFFTPKPLTLKDSEQRELMEEGETSWRFFAFPGPIIIFQYRAFAKFRGIYINRFRSTDIQICARLDGEWLPACLFLPLKSHARNTMEFLFAWKKSLKRLFRPICLSFCLSVFMFACVRQTEYVSGGTDLPKICSQSKRFH